MLYGVGALFAALIIIGFALPSQSRFVVTTEVNAPPATVFALVNDMRRTNMWLPISDLDPNARVIFSGPVRGVGSTRTWDGTVAGSGTQTITESRPYEHVEVRLNLGEPGETRTWFDIAGGYGRTQVSWGFEHDYGLNIVGRYFGLAVTGVIRREYEQSLASLKELGESLPAADFGDLEIEHIVVDAADVALRPASSVPDPAAISEAMADAYFDILTFIDLHGLTEAGAPLSITRRFSGSELRFDAAIPVRGLSDETPESDGSVRLARTYAGSVIRVRHTGSYRSLSDTHRKILAYLAVLDIEQNGDAWETYVSDPTETPESELLTWVYYPVLDR